MENTIDQLNQRYELAINAENDAAFFTRLFEYMDFIDKHEPLNEVHTNEIIAKFHEEIKQRTAYEKLVIQDSDTVIKEMRSVLKKTGVINETIKQSINSYEQWKNKKEQPHDIVAEKLLSHVYAVLAHAYGDPKLKDATLKYAQIDENGILKAWKWSDHKLKLDLEIQRLERLKTTRAWYHADKIAWFHEVYEKYEELFLNEVENERYFNAAGLGMSLGEITAVLKNQAPEKFYAFDPQELKYSLKKYHMEFTSLAKSILLTHENYETQPIRLENGVLYAFGETIAFRRSGLRHNILNTLIETRKEWHWDDLYKETEGSLELEENWKTKIKTACDGLNERISAETKVSDFIYCKDQKAKVDPKYSHLLSA